MPHLQLSWKDNVKAAEPCTVSKLCVFDRLPERPRWARKARMPSHSYGI